MARAVAYCLPNFIRTNAIPTTASPENISQSSGVRLIDMRQYSYLTLGQGGCRPRRNG